MKRQLILALVLTLVVIALLLLTSEDGLAQERPFQSRVSSGGDIGVTPPLWLESKVVKWDGVVYEYTVEGWWFTDNEYPGHHVGDWRTFPVTRDVFWDVLIRDPQGRMTKRLCRLGFIDGERVAGVAACVNGTQYYLPLVIK